MRESLRQDLSQRLQQRLSPLQMKLVRMLEMSEPEIEDEVRRQLDENPALERVDDYPEQEDFHETSEELQRADYAADEDVPGPAYKSYGDSDSSRMDFPIEAAPMSMMENLTSQLAETEISSEDLAIAQYILGNLDDNGYLGRSPGDIADDLAFNAGLDVSLERIQNILDRIKALDPPGIGASDLRECLLLQLRRMKPTEDVGNAVRIVDEYFDLFSLKHYDRLQSALGIDREALRRAEDVIRSLNPKPGASLGEGSAEDRTRHITPDFIVEATPGGMISVTMPNSIPELAIEESFRPDSELMRRTSASANDSAATDFIVRRRNEAEEFINLLKSRTDTLMRVMKAIASIQRDFFVTEDEDTLRPMTLKDISEITGLDQSVISRATAGKYLSTQRATYPLKFFFSSAVAKTSEENDGEASSKTLAALIRSLIEEEPPTEPLTDDRLTEILNSKGFDVKRRTVAKYRDRLGIPVARLRRKI